MGFRWYYVDDSGATDRGWIVYGYIELAAEDWGRALEHWFDFRHETFERHGIPTDYEFHAINFINGRGNPSQNTDWNRDRALRHQVAVAALRALSEMPGVKVGAVVRHTEARRDAYADERRRVYAELLDRLDTRLKCAAEFGAIVVDGDGTDPSYRQRHRDMDRRSRRIIEDPIFQPADSNPLLQIADLVSYTAYQAVQRAPERAFMHDWYDRFLAPIGILAGV